MCTLSKKIQRTEKFVKLQTTITKIKSPIIVTSRLIDVSAIMRQNWCKRTKKKLETRTPARKIAERTAEP